MAVIIKEIVKKGSGYGGYVRPVVEISNRITDSMTISEAESNGYVHLTVDEARKLLRNRRK